MTYFTALNPALWNKRFRWCSVMIEGTPTLAKMMDVAEDLATEYGIAPEDITVYNNHMTYRRIETDEEFETRKANMEASEAKHREFVKRRYAEIMEDEK